MKIRETTLTSGSIVFLGRDENSNDELMEKFKGAINTILHTVAPGSPFCVIENEKPTKAEIYEAGAITAGYSQDWRDNKGDVKVSVFTGKDVNKTKGMKTGTWRVNSSKSIIIKKEDILKFK